jgi:hypothetical protein
MVNPTCDDSVSQNHIIWPRWILQKEPEYFKTHSPRILLTHNASPRAFLLSRSSTFDDQTVELEELADDGLPLCSKNKLAMLHQFVSSSRYRQFRYPLCRGIIVLPLSLIWSCSRISNCTVPSRSVALSCPSLTIPAPSSPPSPHDSV